MLLTEADRYAIAELAARYNHAIDHRDVEAWCDVFTEDGSLVTDGTVRFADRTGQRAHIARALASGQKVQHWIVNPVISGDTHRARLAMVVMAFEYTRGEIALTIMGEYDDDLVKVDGRWKFQTRRVTICGGAYPAHYARR